MVARVRVGAKSILENVRACGPFLGVRCAIQKTVAIHTLKFTSLYPSKESVNVEELFSQFIFFSDLTSIITLTKYLSFLYSFHRARNFNLSNP